MKLFKQHSILYAGGVGAIPKLCVHTFCFLAHNKSKPNAFAKRHVGEIRGKNGLIKYL